MERLSEVISWAKSLADSGSGVDWDGAYGTQCVDLPNTILGKFFGKSIWGNAIDLLTSAQQAGYPVTYNAEGVNPKAGDLFVMATYAHQFGHTGLVIEDSDGYTIKTIEQNVDGNADALYIGGPARYVTRAFADNEGYIVGWISPPYDDKSSYSDTPSTASGFRKLKDEVGTMTVQVAALNVRLEPSTESEVVATYRFGDSFVYDSVYEGAGYIWVSYIGASSGQRRYVAAGQERNGRNVAPFGMFK